MTMKIQDKIEIKSWIAISLPSRSVSSTMGRGDNSVTLIKKVLILVHVRPSPNVTSNIQCVGRHAKLRKRPNPSTSQLSGSQHPLMLVGKDLRRHFASSAHKCSVVLCRGYPMMMGDTRWLVYDFQVMDVSGVTHRGCCRRPCWNRKGSMPEAGAVP